MKFKQLFLIIFTFIFQRKMCLWNTHTSFIETNIFFKKCIVLKIPLWIKVSEILHNIFSLYGTSYWYREMYQDFKLNFQFKCFYIWRTALLEIYFLCYIACLICILKYIEFIFIYILRCIRLSFLLKKIPKQNTQTEPWNTQFWK